MMFGLHLNRKQRLSLLSSPFLHLNQWLFHSLVYLCVQVSSFSYSLMNSLIHGFLFYAFILYNSIEHSSWHIVGASEILYMKREKAN